MAVRIRGGLRTPAVRRRAPEGSTGFPNIAQACNPASRHRDMDLKGSSDHLQQTNAALDHDDMTNLLTRSTVLNIHLSVFTRKSVWQA